MTVATHTAKVLVIDDELGPRESLRILLKMDYEVLVADSVLKGLALLQEHRPDVVIMDIRMPGMTGIEGLREIRKLDADIAVIMLTGFGALETAQEALRLGASDYLKKPFDTKEIMEVVRQNVHRTAQHRRRSSMEHQLQDLQKHLDEVVTRKERMSSLGEASAELVHDLRNPLTVVHGYVQILNEELSQAQAGARAAGDGHQDYLHAIEKGVRRCRDLIDAWQDLGRKTVHDLVPMDLTALLSDIVESQRLLTETHRGALELRVESPGCQILGDATQLGRALQNIIGNASDALHASGGRVQVSLQRVAAEARIAVRDDGVGISEENLARLFQPYFTTKARGRGTGLGLFITRKIIEDHHGSIEISSRPGEGTTVEIRLPLVA
jgi:signal transduction histidine kinase